MIEEKQRIIGKCIGCDKVEGEYCIAYLYPNIKWRLGNCPLASHIEIDTKKDDKTRIGQQKQKKKRRNK